jgi:hypothetical protein
LLASIYRLSAVLGHGDRQKTCRASTSAHSDTGIVGRYIQRQTLPTLPAQCYTGHISLFRWLIDPVRRCHVHVAPALNLNFLQRLLFRHCTCSITIGSPGILLSIINLFWSSKATSHQHSRLANDHNVAESKGAFVHRFSERIQTSQRQPSEPVFSVAGHQTPQTYSTSRWARSHVNWRTLCEIRAPHTFI